jgi:hypothetical protein
MGDAGNMKLSREELAKREIGQTDVSRSLARLLVILFLAGIFIVPTAQYVREFTQWQNHVRISPVPQAWDIFPHFRRAVHEWRWSNLDFYPRVFAVNRELLRNMKEYEDKVEDESWLRERLLPPAQYILSRVFGIGNEKSYIGLGGWLFYRPGVDSARSP